MAVNYYDKVAFQYEKQFYPDNDISNIKIADKALRVISATEMKKGKNVLELGCGTGIYTKLFACTGASIVAVDGSAEMLKFAKSKLDGKVSFVHTNVEDLAFAPVFDCIVGVYILQYTNIPYVLRLVKRMLKDDGKIAFIESNIFNPITLWYAYKNKVAHPLPRFMYSNILRNIGFKNVETTPFEFVPSFCDLPKLHKVKFDAVPIVKELAGSVLVTCNL